QGGRHGLPEGVRARTGVDSRRPHPANEPACGDGRRVFAQGIGHHRRGDRQDRTGTRLLISRHRRSRSRWLSNPVGHPAGGGLLVMAKGWEETHFPVATGFAMLVAIFRPLNVFPVSVNDPAAGTEMPTVSIFAGTPSEGGSTMNSLWPTTAEPSFA